MNPYLIYVAIAIVAVLTLVAVYYHILLLNKKRRDRANEIELSTMVDVRNEKNRKSVLILAQAIIDDQVTLTEASIRINALAQALPLDAVSQESLLVYRQISEATAHIPILEKWKALPKKDKQDFDRQREKIETDFRDFALDIAEKIIANKIKI